MKKYILILFLFVAIGSQAQFNMLVDTLRVEQVILMDTNQVKQLDTATASHDAVPLFQMEDSIAAAVTDLGNPLNDVNAANISSVQFTRADGTFIYESFSHVHTEYALTGGMQPFDTVAFDTTYSIVGNELKGTSYWDDDNRTVSIDLGKGVVLQVGQETLIEVYNNSGSAIEDGKVVYGSGVNGNAITVAKANNNGRYSALLFSTEEIANGSYGFCVELVGKSRGLNTSGISTGEIFVDEIDGEITNDMGVFPEYNYPIGACLVSDASNGVIQFRSSDVGFKNDISSAFDGSIRETFDFRVTSNGTVVTGTLTNPNVDHDSLTLVFSDGWHDFDASSATITMTAGTDPSTQTNYVYIPMSTKVLTISLTEFPAAEHCKIGVFEIQSALNVQSVGGARKNQNHNDHFKYDDDNGHILHLASWIRRQFATWGEVGCEATFDDTGGNGYVSMTAGKVSQLHIQDVLALSMPTVDIMVANDPTTAFVETDNLNTITEFSDGSSWNNEWGKIVVWLIANKTGEPSFLVVNLPRDGESSSTLAIEDRNLKASYAIPTKYKSNAILIAAFAIRLSGGSVTYDGDSQDLRGTIPSNIAGGGGAGGVTTYLALDDTPLSFTANAIQRVNSGGTALENSVPATQILDGSDSIPTAGVVFDNLNPYQYSQTSTVTITGTTTSTTLIGSGEGSLALGGNTLAVGDAIIIKQSGIITNSTGSGENLTIKVILGGTTLGSATGSVTTGASNWEYSLDCMFTVRSIGASGSVMFTGFGLFEVRSGTNTWTVVPLSATSPTTINTTTDNAIDVQGQWASNSLSLSISSLNTLIEKMQ
jgi:hypothetical protein